MSKLFKRFVQPGRLAYINYGSDEGKMCTIIDVATLNRVVIDGPTTGVKRQQIPVRRLTLTDIVTPKVFRGARDKTAKANLNDFERFKLMLARKKRSGQIKAEVKKV